MQMKFDFQRHYLISFIYLSFAFFSYIIFLPLLIFNIFLPIIIHYKNNELFLILKKARQEIASKNKIPAYIIFHDSTLQEISELMPTSKNEFLSINGIGESKLEKYYDIFSTYIINYKISKKLLN